MLHLRLLKRMGLMTVFHLSLGVMLHLRFLKRMHMRAYI